MLNEHEIPGVVADLWAMRLSERAWLDKIGDYARGERGVPEVPEDAGREVKDIAKLSVKNVLGLVVDSFSQNLSVTGYRTAEAQDNDPAWNIWQKNRMDARQALVHVPALTYGASYVTVIAGEDGPVLTPRGPKQILTAYEDPTSGEWPEYAFEMWVTQKGGKLSRLGRLYDDTFIYDLDLGEVPRTDQAGEHVKVHQVMPRVLGEPYEHGASYGGRPVCPVVRFVNQRDAEGVIVGEVAPLIRDQQAINAVNFDRLIVSRFGAFPQKVISGWSGSKAEVLAASARRVWTFEDDNVKATTLSPGSTQDYNEVLDEMIQHVAIRAQISPAQVTGKMMNVSAEALAAAEANQQRKLAAKRESFGESWEQVLRLAAEIDGDEATAADSGAEVMWRDTEARSFGAVVDGVTKLVSVGLPADLLLTMIPGLTQQQIKGIRDSMLSQRVVAMVEAGRAEAAAAAEVPQPATWSSVIRGR